jgi:hypothetical protein
MTGEATKMAKEAKPKAEKKPREKKIAKHVLSARFSLGTDSEGKPYGKDNNPKRGTAAPRFALYRNNMTIQQALDAGLKPADISWDAKMKFIVFRDEETAKQAA